MASITNTEMLRLKSYSIFFQQFSWVFTFGLILSAFVDIMITAFLCYFLRKNRPSFTDTMRIIDTLTFWTIQNGSITCAATIATLVCWMTMPSNRIFLGLHFVVAKLYANSFLATLNARKQIWNGNQYTPSSNRPMPVVFLGESEHGPDSSISQQESLRIKTPQPRAVHHRGEPIQVNIEQIVESKGDDCDAIDSPVWCSVVRTPYWWQPHGMYLKSTTLYSHRVLPMLIWKLLRIFSSSRTYYNFPCHAKCRISKTNAMNYIQ